MNDNSLEMVKKRLTDLTDGTGKTDKSLRNHRKSAQMKNFLKKVFFIDAPAQGAFAGFTLLLAAFWIVPALILLSGDFSLNTMTFPTALVNSISLLGLLFAILYALIVWIRFYFCCSQTNEVRWNAPGSRALYAAVLLSVLLSGYFFLQSFFTGHKALVFAGMAVFTSLVVILWMPLIKFPRNWKIILVRGVCLAAAIGISVLAAAVLAYWFMDTFFGGLPLVFFDCLKPGWLYPAVYASQVLWIPAYMLTALMYAKMSQIPFRKIFGRVNVIILVIWAGIYLFSLAAACRAQSRTEQTIVKLEKHFGRPLAIDTLLSFCRGNRPVDESFWKQMDACMEEIAKPGNEDNTFAQIPGIPMGIYPEETLRQYRKVIEQSEARQQLKRMMSQPLPARRYKTTSDLHGLDFSEHFLCPSLCGYELWSLRLALDDNRLTDAYAAMDRMKRIVDYLGHRPNSFRFTEALIRCEYGRMNGFELLLSSGKVPDGILKQWSSELVLSEKNVPDIHFDTLYAESVFCNDYISRVAKGRFNFGKEYLPGLYGLRFFYPPLWYFSTLERNRLMSQFQVRNFDQVPDPEKIPGIFVRKILPLCRPPKKYISTLTAQYRAMRALIGIELEKRRTGLYPAVLKNSPVDPFNGKPMTYQMGDLEVLRLVWDTYHKNYANQFPPSVSGVAITSVGPGEMNDLRMMIILKPGNVVLQTFAEIYNKRSGMDKWITDCADRCFPRWSEAEKLEWMTRIFPLTDAGSKNALMECANKYDLLLKWDNYAVNCPGALLNARQRKNLCRLLGYRITQKYWQAELHVSESGTYDLHLKDSRSGKQCVFYTGIRKAPGTEADIVKSNADFSICDKNDRHKLFTVRRNAETNCWQIVGDKGTK